MAKKIIIDTDPGIDDATAIFFALASPELDLIGLTTIFGNVKTSLATTNALRLLEIANRPDIPVAEGTHDPLTTRYTYNTDHIHGSDGQGNVYLPPPQLKPIQQTAVNFIIKQAKKFPGEITLVPIGPLTNLALALRLEPNLPNYIHEVVLMGGNAFVPGNATQAAEANIYNDPEAADLVFGADWNVTMVGLDVTHQVNMTRDDIAQYAPMNNPMAQHAAKILPFYLDFYNQFNPNIDGIFVHDSSAIAYVIQPELFKTVQHPIRVETQGLGRGKTWCNTHDPLPPPWQGRPNINICVEVDGRAVIDLEHECIRNAT